MTDTGMLWIWLIGAAAVGGIAYLVALWEQRKFALAYATKESQGAEVGTAEGAESFVLKGRIAGFSVETIAELPKGMALKVETTAPASSKLKSWVRLANKQQGKRSLVVRQPMRGAARPQQSTGFRPKQPFTDR